MDQGNIDSEYKKEIDYAKNKFLDGLKNNKDIKLVEQEYKKDLKKAKDKYYSNVIKSLKQKPTGGNINQKKSETAKNKFYKAESFKPKLGFKDNFRIKKDLFLFIMIFKLKSFFYSPKLGYFSYLKIKIRFKLINLMLKIKIIFQKSVLSIKNFIFAVFKKVKDWFLGFFGKISHFFLKIKEKIFILNKKGKEGQEVKN